MGNRITRTVLFAASALLSISAFGAGAARFGTLRNSDWVVTNAWQAVSNKTHDLIIDLGQEASLPPNWLNVSNAAMSAVQSLQPAYDYSDSAIQNFSLTNSVLSGGPYLKTSYEGATVGYSYSPGGEVVFSPSGIYVAGYSYLTQVAIISEETNGPLSTIQQYGGQYITARQELENYISTNNPAFVSAVIAAPLVGADPSDLSELAEYGSYGTVGAAILALIAGLAALKRGKLDGAAAYPAWVQGDDYEPPAVVSHKGRLWSCQNYTISEPGEEPLSDWLEVSIKDLKQDVLSDAQMDAVNSGATTEKVAAWDGYAEQIAQKANATDLPYALVTRTPENGGATLLDRANNLVTVMANTMLTLPAANPGHSRDLYVRLTVSATSAVTWTVAQGESWDSAGAPPSSFAAGTYLYRFTGVAPGTWHAEDMLALVGLEAALADKMPMYPMVAVTPTSGTLTVAPYTVATYTAGSSAESFTVAVGAGTTGRTRDCILVIDGTATGAVAPTVTWPSNFHPRTDAGTDFACEAETRNVYYISEYAAGEFVVGGWTETEGGNA